MKAHERIKSVIHRTPLLKSHTLNEMTNLELFIKPENFQKVGAFKFRGASNAVASLTPEEAKKGVVTHSSGNHAQAIALAARMRGIPAYIVMPSNAPLTKRKAVEGYGGRITLCAPTVKSREETCKEIMQLHGANLVAPYDDLRVIAGQGTTALEILEDVPEVDAIITPVGGGGLLSGVCIAAKAINPKIYVFGAEPAGADDAYQSLATGARVEQNNPQTICDGLRTSLGHYTWPIIKEHCDGIIRATDEEVREAMFLLWERMKIVVEPSGAIAAAVVLNPNFKKTYPHINKVAIVLSGGNLDLKDWNWTSKL
uniref:Tryptophan synthase beta chain-like PALP domain-containing protein n=1 Tax=Arcella intermedia TaxID=1963864 RepID=A0A6B2LA65_9EUKA